MEKAGIPTVTVVTSEFVALARSTQVSQNLSDMCLVTVPHPVGMIPIPEVKAKADAAFAEIMTAATKWKADTSAVGIEAKPYPAPRFSFTGSYADVHELYKRRGWSLSLPIVPPSVDLVEKMLTGTKRNPSEVVWVVPPRQGMLTVELVAALGVMAGAAPEHMPLLLATVEAMSNDSAAWRGTTTTTGATNPMILISGPIIKKLGLNNGTGVVGPMNPVTNSLGYFVNLVGDIVGGSIPGIDMSTHGSTADFVAGVFVENAAENPWGQSFAEERGFKPTDSVVTISTSYPPNANIDHNSATGKELLNSFSAGIAATATGSPGSNCFTTFDLKTGGAVTSMNYVLIMMGPEHAATIARDFTKQQAKDYVAKNAVLPFKAFPKGTCVPPESFGPVNENTLVPRFADGNGIFFITTGGAGKQTQFLVPFPQVRMPVSVLIRE